MSGLIPQPFINDLLARVDIVDVIDPRVTLKKAGKNYQGLCPFHNEKTPSFSVSPDKQFYHCFGCGVSGTAITFLMEYDRLDFVEAVEVLARQAGVEVPREAAARSRKPDGEQTRIFAALEAAERFFRVSLKQSPQAVAYLRQRGLTGMVARDFAIGYAPAQWQALADTLGKSMKPADLLLAGLLTENDKGRTYDRFRGRIMFPIRDTRGRVIGFGGRVLDNDDGPKYLNSPETPVFHKGRELYGLYEARKALRQISSLLVVEGYMDVVALAQAGVANCVASLGTATTTEHFHKLYRYTAVVVCCFDGDAAGRQAAWRALENALETLTDGRQLKFMFLPEGEDPDTLIRREGKDAFGARVAAASPAIEYLFSRLGEGLDLTQLDGQAKLASLAMPYIERVPVGILKQLMNQRLETLTGFAGAAAVPGPVKSPPPAQSRGPGLSGLQKRLLGFLFQAPELAAGMDEPTRVAVADLSATDVFADIVHYVAENPGVEEAEVVARWTGHPIQAELLSLVGRPPGLEIPALGAEFNEGMRRYAVLARRQARRELLARLKEAPSTETLQEFWSQRQDDVVTDSAGTPERAVAGEREPEG